MARPRTARQRMLSSSFVAGDLGATARRLYDWRVRGVGPPWLKLDSGAIVYPADDYERWRATWDRSDHGLTA